MRVLQNIKALLDGSPHTLGFSKCGAIGLLTKLVNELMREDVAFDNRENVRTWFYWNQVR